MSQVPLSQYVFDGVLPNPRGYENRQRELARRRGETFITKDEGNWQRIAANVMFDMAAEGTASMSTTGNPWEDVADDVLVRDSIEEIRKAGQEKIQQEAQAALADPNADLGQASKDLTRQAGDVAGAAAVLQDRAARQADTMLRAEADVAALNNRPEDTLRRAVEMTVHGAPPSQVTAELNEAGWTADRKFDRSFFDRIDTEIEILKDEGEFNRARLLQIAKLNMLRTGTAERDVNVTPTDVYLNEMLAQNAENAPAYEHFSIGAANGFTATSRALARLMGMGGIPDRDRDILEQMSQASFAEAPFTTGAGMFAGGIADPVFFGLGELASGLKVGKAAREAWIARQVAKGANKAAATTQAAKLTVRDIVTERIGQHYTKVGLSEQTAALAARATSTALEGALANAAAEGLTEGAYTDQPWAIARRMAEGALVGAVAGPVLDLVVQGVSAAGRAGRRAAEARSLRARGEMDAADAAAQAVVDESLGRAPETRPDDAGGADTPPVEPQETQPPRIEPETPVEPLGPQEPPMSRAEREMVRRIEKEYRNLDDDTIETVAGTLRRRLEAGEEIEGGPELLRALQTVYRKRTGTDVPFTPDTPTETVRTNEAETPPEAPQAEPPKAVDDSLETREPLKAPDGTYREQAKPDDIVAYMARETDEPARADMSPEELEADIRAEEELHRGNLAMLAGADDEFVKIRVPTTELGYTGNIAANPAERAIAERYAKMPAKTQPPLVAGYATDPNIVPGQMLVIDGKHRLVGSEIRGDTEVDVYVPRSTAERYQAARKAPKAEPPKVEPPKPPKPPKPKKPTKPKYTPEEEVQIEAFRSSLAATYKRENVEQLGEFYITTQAKLDAGVIPDQTLEITKKLAEAARRQYLDYGGQPISSRDIEDVMLGMQKTMAARTGEPFRATTYRGSGRADRASAYAEGVTGPVMGDDAIYYALNRGVAKQFGPNITEQNVQLDTPFVIREADDVKAVMNEPPPREASEMQAYYTRLRDVLQAQGYDGVVVDLEIPKTGETIGRKPIQEAFSDSQVIEFNKADAPSKPAEEAPKQAKGPEDAADAQRGTDEAAGGADGDVEPSDPLTDEDITDGLKNSLPKGQNRRKYYGPKYGDENEQFLVLRQHFPSGYRPTDRASAELVRAKFQRLKQLSEMTNLAISPSDHRVESAAFEILSTRVDQPDGFFRFEPDVPKAEIDKIVEQAEKIIKQEELAERRRGKPRKTAKTAGKSAPRALPAKPDPKGWSKSAAKLLNKRSDVFDPKAVGGESGKYLGTHNDGTHELITDGFIAVRRPSTAKEGSVGFDGATGTTGADRRKSIMGSFKLPQKVVRVIEATDLESIARSVNKAAAFSEYKGGVIIGATPDGRLGYISGGPTGVAQLGSAGDAGFQPLTVVSGDEFVKLLGGLRLGGEDFVRIHFGDITDRAGYRALVYVEGMSGPGVDGVIMPKIGTDVEKLIAEYQTAAGDAPRLPAPTPTKISWNPSGQMGSPIGEGNRGGPERLRTEANPGPLLSDDLDPERWGKLETDQPGAGEAGTPVTLYRPKTEARIRREDKAMRADVARAKRDADMMKGVDSPHALIDDLFRELGVAAPRVGGARSLGKQYAGFYRAWTEGVRLWKKDGVGTAIHELGHAMHKIMFPTLLKGKPIQNRITPQAFPTRWRKELVKLGRNLYGSMRPNAGYTAEGWAEYWRYAVVDPAYLKREAPTVYNEVTRLLVKEHPRTWAALQKARGRWKALQSSERPIAQYIDRKRGKAPTVLKNLYDDMRIILFDRMERIVRLKRDAGLSDIPAELDPEIAMRRARQVAGGEFDNVLDQGVFDPMNPTKVVGPSLKGILEPIQKSGKRALFEEYLVAKRAVEKRGQGYTLTLGELEDARIARFIEETESQHPELVKAAQDFQQLNEWLVRDYAVAHGLIDEATAEKIIDKNLHYITFRHVRGDDAVAPARRGRGKQGFADQKSGLGRFREGVGEQLYPPIETFMSNMRDVMTRANLNRSAVLLTDIVNGTPGMARWMERIERPQEAVKVRAEDMRRKMMQTLGIGEHTIPDWMTSLSDDEFTRVMSAIDNIGEGVFFKPGMRLDKELGQFTVIRDGKPEFYEVADKRLMDLLEGVNNMSTLTWVHRLMHIPAAALKLGTTQLSPEFFVPNGFRDTFMALVVSKRGMADLPADARARIRGVRAALLEGGWGDLLELFGIRAHTDETREVVRAARAGGVFYSGEFDEYLDRRTGAINFDEMFRPKSLLRRIYNRDVKGAARDVLTLGPVRRLNNSIEMMTRLAEFEAVRQAAGAPGGRRAIAEAGQAAADVTLDFSRGGTLSRDINYISAFFNAAMLGTDKLARFIRANPGKAAGTIASYIVAPSLLQHYLNRDNEDYWNKPYKERDRHWMFPIPGSENANGQPRYIQIPKPYGLGIFGILTERNLARIDGIDPVSGKRGVDNATRNLGDSIMDELLPSLSIMGVQPVLEAFANYSFFYNEPIVKDWEESLPYDEQGRERASQVGRIVGTLADVAPVKVDHVIKGLTGGLGRTALQLTDPLLRGITGDEANDRAPMRADDYFLLRRFLEGPARSDAEVLAQFFEEYERVERRRRGFGARKDDPAEQREYRDRHRAELERYETLQPIRSAISDKYARLRALYADEEMDGDELDRRIDQTFAEMFELARRGLLKSRGGK